MDDFCFVCNALMDNSLKADLSMMTSYSEKPIYQIIGMKSKKLQNFSYSFKKNFRGFYGHFIRP